MLNILKASIQWGMSASAPIAEKGRASIVEQAHARPLPTRTLARCKGVRARPWQRGRALLARATPLTLLFVPGWVAPFAHYLPMDVNIIYFTDKGKSYKLLH